MLSRTADSLFWIGRYVERADFVARVLDATGRLAAIPSSSEDESQVWRAALAAAAPSAEPSSVFGDTLIDGRGVREFLGLSPANPSSIRACLTQARANARSVRTALTAELWEALNDAYNGLTEHGRPRRSDEFAQFVQWTKSMTLAVEGAASRTLLRNDGYWFLKLGGALERADNTARLLDVKYHLLLPEDERVGGQFDYFQWTTLLREVSALTAYRWVYRDAIRPWLVADLLVLNPQMPRSLASCQAEMVDCLNRLATLYGRRGPSQRLASARLARFEGERMDGIFQSGLHEYIQQFLAENAQLGVAVTDQYLL